MESIRGSRVRRRWTRSRPRPTSPATRRYCSRPTGAEALSDADDRRRDGPPVRALVIGAGVAGLQAIATAGRLGRGRLGLRRAAGRAGAGREPWRVVPGSGRPRRGDRRRLRDELRQSSSAATGRPGRADSRLRRRHHDRCDSRSPCAEARHGVRRRAHAPGSVIVDLAAETGGNCELTVPVRSSSSMASRSWARRTSRR